MSDQQSKIQFHYVLTFVDSNGKNREVTHPSFDQISEWARGHASLGASHVELHDSEGEKYSFD